MEFRNIISGKIINKWDFLTLPYSEQEYYKLYSPTDNHSGFTEKDILPDEYQSGEEETSE